MRANQTDSIFVRGGSTETTGRKNVAGALCYTAGLLTGILFLVLPAHRRNTAIRYHAFQAILFHVVWLASLLGEMTVAIFLPFSCSPLWIGLNLFLWGGGFSLWLALIWRTYHGRKPMLPVIGALADWAASQEEE